MFNNVRFFAIEKNSFAVANAKNKQTHKKNRKSFHIREGPVLYSKLEHLRTPNSHTPILPIKLYLAPMATYCDPLTLRSWC